jgi:hypothetical protein
MLWTGAQPATGCTIAPATGVDADFLYQTTLAATNALTGAPNTPVTIPPFGGQTFLVAFTPRSPLATTEIALRFACAGVAPAVVMTGIDTLALSASTTPTPDVVAVSATPTNDGIVGVGPPSGAGAFAVATTNVGATGTITVVADTGGVALPVSLAVCRTLPTGQCAGTIGTAVTETMAAGSTATFSVFVTASNVVPFDPATNRVYLRFFDGAGVLRGRTSVAVRAP